MHPYALLAAASLLLAAASLLLGSAPAYDPWAWIIWGREIVHFQLHTFGGPTWKPLPVLVTALAAPIGSAAPALWLLVARAGGLMAVGMAALLALRLLEGGRRVSVVVAVSLSAGGVLALSGFVQSVWGGESEGLLAAACLLAVARHLDGDPRQALWWTFAAALIRPETWVFFALYALYVRRREPGAARTATAMAVAIPALWFLPDLIGSGSLTRGVQWAQYVKAGSPAHARCPFCSELTGHAWPLLGAPFKVGALLACLGMARRRTRVVAVGLVGIGLAWAVEEAVLTQAGFSGSDRYLLAPAALVTVAGAIGWGSVLGARRWLLTGGALALTAALALVSPWPGPHFERAFDGARYQARLGHDLSRAVAQAGGPRRLLACGPVQTNPSEVPLVAWTLRAPMRSAESSAGEVVVASADSPGVPRLPQARAGYRTIARVGEVRILSRCYGVRLARASTHT